MIKMVIRVYEDKVLIFFNFHVFMYHIKLIFDGHKEYERIKM